jgi:sugar phosphate isomerase/epimerase
MGAAHVVSGMEQPRIGLQLYSVREDAARDMLGVLERAAALGFEGVETAGLHGMAAQEVGAAARALGLEIVAAHVGWAQGEPPARALDEAVALGAPALVIPSFSAEVFSDARRIGGAAASLDVMARAARARGLALGYHNHEWEFASRIDGRSAHALLIEAVDPSVLIELDVYWARVGGADPAALLRRLGPRARWLHLKDGPADSTDGPMRALGTGALDLPSILAAARAAWWIVELDACQGDMWDALAESQSYLRAIALRA